MRAKISITLLLILLLLSGCQSNKKNHIAENKVLNEDTHNPFDTNNKEVNKSGTTETLGAISHFAKELMSNDSKERKITYQGGELQLDYWLKAEGIAKKCGFLIYINGIPQPYKIANLENEYKYIHALELKEEESEFTFLFTPITGKKGETLTFSVISMINPLFSPDMIETTAYGYSHGILEANYIIEFMEDSNGGLELDAIQRNAIKNISISNIAMSDADKVAFQNKFEAGNSLSDKKIYTNLYIDGEDMTLIRNYDINKKAKIDLKFEMIGFPGVKYKNILYFNHQPICYLDQNWFEFELQKGYNAVLELEINLKELDEKGTFYIISIPTNANYFPESLILACKTSSIFIYDSSKLAYDSNEDEIQDKAPNGQNYSGIHGEAVNLGRLEGSIENIFNMGDNEFLIISDKVYLYNANNDTFLSSVDRKPNAAYVSAKKIENGYVIIGETGECIQKEVQNYETGKMEMMNFYNLACTFYNENFMVVETVDLINEIGNFIMPHSSQISISKGGKKIACISGNRMHLYDRITKEKKVIFNSLEAKNSAGNEITITHISFADNNRIVFLANSIDENIQMYPGYGMISIENSDFTFSRGESFGKLTSYPNVTIMSQEDSLKGDLGEIWLFQHETNDIVKWKLKEKAESGHVWGSNTGKHFATLVRVAGKGWNIRIYDLMTGVNIFEQLYEDKEVDLYKDPYIYIIDNNRSIILFFRTGSRDKTNKLLIDGF